ncbi:1-phosphatidylinositol 4,5-bisphosphate phosphodiesterase 1 [Erysiphe neolycopersici]|uniref:Phosphoinositide phospholipase C n=1 Tax=Erysiphe neolycopersici TaxID=212602 RepID=A0A420HZ82_9PEZI|nr:1-phosphatidylinositol 4,5-bisphosphate phosphodiesterase 1 [Erysiphe neolycopersici]
MTATAIDSIEGNKLIHDDHGKDHEDERIDEKERSTKHSTLTVAIKSHLRAVYDSLVKISKEPTNKTLNQSHFEEWLLNVQRVSSLRAKLCQEKDDGYSFDDWLNALFVHGFLEAQKEPEPKDLTKTLSNYYISSSHNTYLSGNQLMSRSKTGAYKNVLRRGCRCIEVDVHNGDIINNKTVEESPANKITVSQNIAPESSQPNVLSTRIASLIDRARQKRMRRLTEKRLADSNVQDQEILSPEQGKVLEKRISSLSLSSDSSSPSSSDDESFIESQVIHGEPIVMHGWTLTAPVGFRAVCRVIGQEAFKSSELPLIVSLEVHVDLEQQKTMVKIMKEEWGDMLVQAPIPGCNPKETLPKLEQLKRKILVKVKKCQQQQEQQPLQIEKKGELDTVGKQVDCSMPKDFEVHGQGSPGNENSDTSIAVNKKKTKICESLSNLGVYTHTEHFSRSFSSVSAQLPAHIFSIGESDLIDLDKNQRQELFTHNRNYIMRTYPAARRIDSSNPHPILFWRRGIQIVAMNWQKLDQGMMLNEGMFSGELGWALKPVGYHSSDSNGGNNGNSKSETRVGATAAGTTTVPTVEATAETAVKAADRNAAVKIMYQNMAYLRITILAGQHIPVPIDTTVKKFCPYICGELHICEDDEKIRSENELSGRRGSSNNNGNSMSNKYKQKTQYLEGDQLDFGRDGYQMNFHIHGHIQEDLSFFRFKIKDSRYLQDVLAAWACIRLDRLQSGYRLVRLLDTKSQETSGLLLVIIDKKYRPGQSPSTS